MSRIRPSLALLALLVLVAPTAAAAVNEPTPVRGELGVPDDFARLADDFFLMAGRMEVSGDSQGPLFVLDDAGSRFQVPVLRVYDMRDKVSLAFDGPALELFNATLEPAPGADYAWAATNITLDARSAFSTGFLFDLLSHLEAGLIDYTGQTAPFPPTLVATMGDEAWQVAQRDTERSFYVPLGESAFTIRDHTGAVVEPTSASTDPQWLVTFHGATGPLDTTARVETTLLASGAAVPIAAGASLGFGRATDDGFRRGFSIDRFAGFIEDFLDLRSGVPDLPEAPDDTQRDLAARCAEERPPSDECRRYYEAHKDEFEGQEEGQGTTGDDPMTADNETVPSDAEPEAPETEGETSRAVREAMGVFQDLGGFANGVLIGRLNGTVALAGESYDEPGLTVMRFTELDFDVLPPDRVGFEGQAVMTYTDGSMPTDAAGVRAGPMFLPLWAIAFWLVAIGALLATKYYSLRDRDDALTHKLTMPAIATHVVLVVVGFLLFDIEMRYLFGTSLLTSVGVLGYASPFVAASTVGPLALGSAQLGLWGIAWLLFGLPVKLIGRSALLMFGLMKPTWHFAAGLAGIATWWFGAAAVLPILGTALAAFL